MIFLALMPSTAPSGLLIVIIIFDKQKKGNVIYTERPSALCM